MIVVIPTAREVNLAYLAPLIDAGARFIVVDDSEGRVTVDHPRFQVLSWADHERLLGPNAVAIPRGTGACRDLGFYLAWKESEPGEMVIALDDDCEVFEPEFARSVERRLAEGTHVCAQGAGHHLNIFDLLTTDGDEAVFARGFPYSSRVGYRPWRFDGRISGTVRFNLGLWKGAWDINAIDKLTLSRTDFPETELVVASAVVPPGAFISVCSGNMQFRRELIPAVYQWPMNVEVLTGWTIDRHGDIWAGFALKKLMDKRGDLMSVGGPLVRHAREGPVNVNIAKEHLALIENEYFIELLAGACENLDAGDYLEMMSQLRERLRSSAEHARPILGAYLRHLDRCLGAWLTALG